MKKIFVLCLLVLILPSALALNISVQKVSSNEVMIYEFQNPVSFDLEVKNLGSETQVNFYNLLGLEMTPREKINLEAGEGKSIQMQIKPIANIDYEGKYAFTYYIKGEDATQEETLSFDIVKLKNVFEIGSGAVNLDSNIIPIYVKNKVNYNFDDVKVKFSSPFFEVEKTLSLGANEKKVFDVEVNQEDFKKLMAGFYTLRADIEADGEKTSTTGIMKFVEKDVVKTEEENTGLFVNTHTIRKINDGNTVQKTESTVKKNAISRLFTSFSEDPDSVTRDGFVVYYSWQNEVKPGETLEIVVKTNWFFPVLLGAFVLIVVVLAKRYTEKNVALRKKISFIKTRGGEFALKISIVVSARKYVENVCVTDRLPSLMKIYGKFDMEQPTRVDEKKGVVEWNFEKLEAGEKRRLSYVMYSKVGVIGKFALPSTTAIYQREGEIKESQSNRSFFVSEQKGEKLAD